MEIDGLNCILCEGEYAYKDGQFYPLWRTVGCMMVGNCIGFMYYVLDENNEILSQAYPMMSLTKGFERFDTTKMDSYLKIVEAWNKRDQ